MKILNYIRNAAVVTIPLMALVAVSPVGAESYPERDITMVVQSSAGGGSDTFGRTVANVIQKHELLPARILIENRPGGSGSIAYNYIAQRAKNPHYVGTLATSFFTSPLLGLSPTDYNDFTLIGAIAADPFILVANAGSQIKNLDDIKRMDSIRVGNTGPITDAAMLGYQLANQLDLELRAVPFNGSGEVATALLGNHIDLEFGNVTQVMAQIAGGRMHPIAVTSSERLANYPDVPTFAELGLDIELELYRGFMMPADMPEDVISYWEDVLYKVSQSQEWKENYIEKTGAIPLFLTSEELNAKVPSIVATYEEFINTLKK